MTDNFLRVFLIFFAALMVWLYFRMGKSKSWKKPAGYFSVKDRSILASKVRFFQKLSEEEKRTFEYRIVEFLSNVKVSGVDIKVTRADELLVAAGAVIPVFRFPEWQYNDIVEVLLYPGGFDDQFGDGENDDGSDNMGMVGDGALDEKMILSKQDLHLGFSNGFAHTNVAVHEFIHIVEKETGAAEGIPKLFAYCIDTVEWGKLARAEMESIRKGKSDITEYALEDMQEFFATVSEYFFMDRDMFRSKHPELNEFLEKMYKTANR